MATRQMRNSKFKSVAFCLKIDLVSHPVRGGEVGKIHTYEQRERERERERDGERERENH